MDWVDAAHKLGTERKFFRCLLTFNLVNLLESIEWTGIGYVQRGEAVRENPIRFLLRTFTLMLWDESWPSRHCEIDGCGNYRVIFLQAEGLFVCHRHFRAYQRMEDRLSERIVLVQCRARIFQLIAEGRGTEDEIIRVLNNELPSLCRKCRATKSPENCIVFPPPGGD